MIQIGLDVVGRLGAAIERGLGAGPRGMEIGGILLGRTLPGFGRAVLVEDFELTPCEHLRGASFTLSPKDRRQLGTRLERRPPREVVGYFRSHTRPGMYLDQDDFAVFSQSFPEAWQVFLLVRPATDGPATGGFFFWEDGEIDRRSTYRQFPFEATLLAQGNYPITGEKVVAAPAALRPSVTSVSGSTPVLIPKPKSEAREQRRLPALPWIVVPVIAVLFLIAGLFVSENQPPAPETVAAKAIPPVEPLLPEPVPAAAATQPEPVAPAPAQAAAEVPVTAPATPRAKPQPAKKLVSTVALPPPVTVARVAPREVEKPPALAAPAERIEARLPTVLPARVTTPPPPEAEVSYEPAHAGVFKRALHKIEGDQESGAFVAALPVHKAALVRPANAGGELLPVDVKVSIDESGNVTRAQVLTKGSYLAAAALGAARQWQFKPARKHDKPVSSEMVLHFHF